ncbi:hypothetical protein JRO89_XS12G0099700 [Xanthoceras sorbifolium]|uniref:Uncharacterized protein n=1 Tax=Xanthoceras sorbifolium TaxID=99658 RepID=A0ABQ8HC09_9ROSI|nr:hypothetical protein JRO89_XS12G0099700 [Xanthoceras sorbifolium]
MSISKDRVKPSPLPDSWKLAEIFLTGIILGDSAYFWGFKPTEKDRDDRRNLADNILATFVIAQLVNCLHEVKGKEERDLKWARAQMTLQGLQPLDSKMFSERNSFTELNLMAEEAKRRAEIARLYNDCNHACHDDKLVLILAASSVFILLPVDGILSTFL